VVASGDSCRGATVQGAKTLVHVRPLGLSCTLLVAHSRNVSTAAVAPAIDRAADLVERGTPEGARAAALACCSSCMRTYPVLAVLAVLQPT
jgi:hypothetical protein